MKFSLGDAEPRSSRIVKRVVLAVILLHIPIWVSSTYRAWHQIYDLRMDFPDTLRAGTRLHAVMVTSGRTEADTRIELQQGDKSVRLVEFFARRNWDAAYDFRWRRAEGGVVVTARHLSGFAPGAATLRVSAVGRPQWMRVPPPTVQERTVWIDSLRSGSTRRP